MDDAGDKFFQLADRLGISGDSPHGMPALEFWLELVELNLHDKKGKLPIHVLLQIENAVEARVVMFRLQTVLGKAELYLRRTGGPLKDVPIAHPVVEDLANMHERLRKLMDELTSREKPEQLAAPVGFHESMLQLMKEADGVLAEVLGFKPGEGGPLEPKFPAGESG